MKTFINIKVIFIVTVIVVAVSCTQKTTLETEIIQVTDSLKNIYAPDKRIALFNVDVLTEKGDCVANLETDNPKAENDFINLLKTKYPKVKINTKLYPDTTFQGNHWGVIKVSVANIKSKPAHSSELASQTVLGTVVKLLKANGSWILAQTPDKYLGWIHESSIQKCNVKEINQWIDSEKVIYVNHAGFVYGLKDKSNPVSDITAGSILKIVEENKNVYKVSFPDGRIGFVGKNNVENYNKWIQSHDYQANDILERAMQFMGHPYLWGGTSTKAVDCSGFTKTVYFLNGIVLQRDASQQELYGDKISLDNNLADLLPGDLLFFGRAQTDSTTKKITHVGIYTGNLNFIHASGRVHHDSFNPEDENYNEYRHKTLVSARRVLTAVNTLGIEEISRNTFYQPQK